MIRYLTGLIDDWLYRFGYIKEQELYLRALPEKPQRRARKIWSDLHDIKKVSSWRQFTSLTKELEDIFRKNLPELRTPSKKVKEAFRILGGQQANTYRPALSRLYGLFPDNPFGVYAFVARHHWAVTSCLNVIRDEIVSDGFQLKAEKGTSKRRMKEVYRLLKDMGIFELRRELCIHLRLYGNAWVRPQRNLLGGAGAFELLSPPNLLPVIDQKTDQIVGWDYQLGMKTIRYELDDLHHIYAYSFDGYQKIGDPPLYSAIMAIEADLNADAYNNQVFQKGGLMGIIMSIKPPEGDPLARDEEDLIEELQDRIDAQYSGTKAGASVLVGSHIDNVYTVGGVGKLEMSFQALHMETAKTVAQCLGVPPEKIAISRSSNLQYIPSLVEDSVNAQFDKSLTSLVTLADDFINDKILREHLGIYDVRIGASGRYGALTRNAAETIRSLAAAGPLITVNMALERILGWEALPANNPRGNFVLDNSVNRNAGAVAQLIDPPAEDPNFGKGLPQQVNDSEIRLEFEVPGKAIHTEDFIQWVETIRKGNFERIDRSADCDDALVHLVIIKNGEERYYENFCPQDRKEGFKQPQDARGSDTD